MTPEPLRIAFFSDFSLRQISGVSDALRITMTGLRKRGHLVRLYAPTFGTGPLSDEEAGFPSVSLPRAPDMRIVFPFGRSADLRKFCPDIIHTHTFAAVGLRALHAARRLRVPLVGTDHTFPTMYLHYVHLDYAWAQKGIRRFTSWYYRHCDRVIAPSQEVADELRTDGIGKEVHILQNPIDTDLFRELPDKEQLKKKLGIGKFAILCFGRLATEKNVDDLLRAFVLVRQEKKDAELIIVGGGPEEHSLRSLSRSLGIADAVRFTGVLKGQALVEMLNATDVSVIPSRHETQSLTTLQSMACGLPIVSIEGALPSYMVHGETGFTVPANNLPALSSHLLSLLRDSEKRREFGDRTKKTAENFSPDVILSTLENLYRDTILSHRISR